MYMTIAVWANGRTVNRMAEHIEKQAVIMALEKHWNGMVLDVFDFIRNLPSVDAQQVVRCKDCRYRYLDKKYGFRCDLDTGDPFDEGRSAENDDWFCADGVKMDGEQNDRT